MMIKEAIKDFLIESPKAYRPTLTQFGMLFGDRTIQSLTQDDYEKFWNLMKNKFENTTIRWKLTLVKIFINQCTKTYGLRMNVRRLKMPIVLSRRAVATKEEYEKMCSVLNGFEFSDLQKLVMMKFLAMGMRIGEVAALNISDFKLPNRHAIILSEKSKRERYIAWNSDETHELITRLLGIRICLNSAPYLFLTSGRGKRTRVTTRTLERWFTETRIRAGVVRELTPHTFRHMAAHTARDAGADLRALQEILGHSNPMSTNNYTNLCSNEALASVQRFTLA